MYLPASHGGLGLFNLKTYLDAQKCSWIVRASKKCIDNWRFDLKNLSPNGNISKIRISDVDATRHPVLYNLVSAFTNLVEKHAKINGNYKLACIFENGAFRYGVNDRAIDRNFFGQAFYNRHKNAIRNLRFCDCYEGNSFKTLEQFAQMGLPLNMNNWLCLRGALKKARGAYRKLDPILEAKS